MRRCVTASFFVLPFGRFPLSFPSLVPLFYFYFFNSYFLCGYQVFLNLNTGTDTPYLGYIPKNSPNSSLGSRTEKRQICTPTMGEGVGFAPDFK